MAQSNVITNIESKTKVNKFFSLKRSLCKKVCKIVSPSMVKLS